MQKHFIVDIRLGLKYASILNNYGNCLKTRIAFTPIIPYPVTDLGHSWCMYYGYHVPCFQNVLSRKALESGYLRSDESVYCIAKELQLLDPIKFGNNSFDLRCFCQEKIGKHNTESSVDSIFVEHEIFSHEVVNSVMRARNWLQEKCWIELISKALQSLQFSKF